MAAAPTEVLALNTKALTPEDDVPAITVTDPARPDVAAPDESCAAPLPVFPSPDTIETAPEAAAPLDPERTLIAAEEDC